MTIGMNFRSVLPRKYAYTNGDKQMSNPNNGDWTGPMGKWLLWWTKLVVVAMIAMYSSGCAGKGEDDNCSSTVNCPDDPDGGLTADADDTAPDADTTADANNADACAEYANVPSDGWQCSANNNPPIDMNGLTFVVEDGICLMRSDAYWCQDTPPSADVEAGQFSCTDINGYSVTCWHI